MKTHNLCFLGFGNVGRALARLFVIKSAELRELYGIEWRITGVATRRLGWLSNADGFKVETLLGGDTIQPNTLRSNDIREWLDQARPDALLETTSLNVETGQPAIDYLRAALQSGAHAITANKGAVVHGYDELRELAQQSVKRFLFESTV